ncbi:MAG: GIY-YIG nuclease family protein [Anaeromyxobacter sp.]
MLECADGTYYTGHTEDLEARLAEHQAGETPGYTKKRRPVELVWCAEFARRDEALERELQIKGWTRAKKQALIEEDWGEIRRLARGPDRKLRPRSSFDFACPERSAAPAARSRRAQDERDTNGSRAPGADPFGLSVAAAERPRSRSPGAVGPRSSFDFGPGASAAGGTRPGPYAQDERDTNGSRAPGADPFGLSVAAAERPRSRSPGAVGPRSSFDFGPGASAAGGTEPGPYAQDERDTNGSRAPGADPFGLSVAAAERPRSRSPGAVGPRSSFDFGPGASAAGGTEPGPYAQDERDTNGSRAPGADPFGLSVAAAERPRSRSPGADQRRSPGSHRNHG